MVDSCRSKVSGTGSKVLTELDERNSVFLVAGSRVDRYGQRLGVSEMRRPMYMIINIKLDQIGADVGVQRRTAGPTRQAPPEITT